MCSIIRSPGESRGGDAPSGRGLGVSPRIITFPFPLLRERGIQGVRVFVGLLLGRMTAVTPRRAQ